MIPGSVVPPAGHCVTAGSVGDGGIERVGSESFYVGVETGGGDTSTATPFFLIIRSGWVGGREGLGGKAVLCSFMLRPCESVEI